METPNAIMSSFSTAKLVQERTGGPKLLILGIVRLMLVLGTQLRQEHHTVEGHDIMTHQR